jgi:hypothetical protein
LNSCIASGLLTPPSTRRLRFPRHPWIKPD